MSVNVSECVCTCQAPTLQTDRATCERMSVSLLLRARRKYSVGASQPKPLLCCVAFVVLIKLERLYFGPSLIQRSHYPKGRAAGQINGTTALSLAG